MKYTLSFAGRESDRKIMEFDSVDEARNEAVRYLGAYLTNHPEFADEGHWRVNVKDMQGKALLHVIVATVTMKGSTFTPPPERSTQS